MNDDELLNYLMTSDFSDNLGIDEMKRIIIYFRNYVRKVYGINKSLDYKIDDLEKRLEYKDITIKKLKSDIESSRRRYEVYLKRKLTWRERLFGNIEK